MGLAGRLTGETVGHEFVKVIPGSVEGLIDWDLGTAENNSPLPLDFPDLGARDFVVLFCGGYNTWLDGDTMLDGLLRAMDQHPGIHYVSTGGALRGHDESSYRRFRNGALSSDHNRRFHFLGWIPGNNVPAVFARAQLSLFVDLPCYEAEFGARTRVLESLERRVPVAATNFCDLTSELVDTELFHELPSRNPEAIATLLVELANRHQQGIPLRLGQGSVPWQDVRKRHSIATTTEPLIQWLRAPKRSPGGVPIDFLEDYWQELARLQDRLEEVWKSPTWRYLGRIHRVMSKSRKNND